MKNKCIIECKDEFGRKDMEIIKGKIYDEERAFYGVRGLKCVDCKFDGPQDGESAFKESGEIEVEDCVFNLRYPFWHDRGVKTEKCRLTENCRAAFWYTENAEILNSELHGIKALRECRDIHIENSDIVSAEFGWFSHNVHIENSRAEGEYFMLRSSGLEFKNLSFKGKYSFQYVENSVIENCNLDTKDAFWHAKNVTVKNSVVKGEYLAWYAENITFENCEIIGTQPLCYCKGLKLVNCSMKECDLSFEKSEVEATVTSHVDSIKNPIKGSIEVASVGEIIDEYQTKCKIEVTKCLV